MLKLISSVLGVLVVLLICSSSFAMDTSVYKGVWEHKSKDLTIKLFIGSDGPKLSVNNVIVNGKDLGKVQYDFLYGNRAAVPFLLIAAGDINKGYSLYLILGTEKEDLDAITGYYLLSISENDHDVTQSDTYRPVNFRKVSEK